MSWSPQANGNFPDYTRRRSLVLSAVFVHTTPQLRPSGSKRAKNREQLINNRNVQHPPLLPEELPQLSTPKIEIPAQDTPAYSR